MLDTGVVLGVLNWADIGFAKRTLKMISEMDLTALRVDAKLDILEWSCNMSGTKHAFYPWHSTCENQVSHAGLFPWSLGPCNNKNSFHNTCAREEAIGWEECCLYT